MFRICRFLFWEVWSLQNYATCKTLTLDYLYSQKNAIEAKTLKGKISSTPRSDNHTIFRAHRSNNAISQSTNPLFSTKLQKPSKNVIKPFNKPDLAQKKLEFNSKKRQRQPSPLKSSKKSKLHEKIE